METTERIVETYVRFLKRCATIPNIRCDGQYEIDLLAIGTTTASRYHIETSVSASQSFSKLTAKAFDRNLLKERVQQPSQRRTIGFFIERKFREPAIVKRLADYGFVEGNHQRVVVTWGWTPEAKEAASAAGIELWDFRDMLDQIAEALESNKSYFTDDTLRTINLMVRSKKR